MTVPTGLDEPHPRAAGGRRILVNTLYSLTADVGSKLASLALVIVMARRLGAAGYGVFVYASSFSAIIFTLAHFGQDQVLTREVAADRTRAQGYFSDTMAMKLVVAIPVASVALTVYWLVEPSGPARLTVALVSAAGLAELGTSTCLAMLQAYERLGFIPAVRITQRFVTAAIGIAALLAGASVAAIALSYLMGAILALSIALVSARRVAHLRLDLNLGRWAPLARAAIPVGVAGVLASVLFRIDMVMLGALRSAAVVGNYGAAYRLLDTTLFLTWSVSAAVYPVFARLSSPWALTRVFFRATKLLVALSLPMAVGVTVLARPLIALFFGSGFAQAPTALLLLAPTIALYPIATFAGLFLIARRRSRSVTAVYAILTVENVILNLLLIPALSLYGAAIGTSLTELLAAAALVAIVRRQSERFSWVRVLAGPILASVGSLVAMTLLRAHLLAAVSVGASVYAILLLALERMLFPGDIRAIVRSLRPDHVERLPTVPESVID